MVSLLSRNGIKIEWSPKSQFSERLSPSKHSKINEIKALSSLSLSLELSVGLTMYQFVRYGGDLCWLFSLLFFSLVREVALGDQHNDLNLRKSANRKAHSLRRLFR